MKQLILILLFSLLQNSINLFGQVINPTTFYLKVKTDSGIIKKNLWEVGDSSIWVTDPRMFALQSIPVKSIYYINVIRPVITTVSRDMASGAVFGGVLFTLAYVEDWARHTNHLEPRDFTDPYLKSLGYSAILGASVGFITGLIQAVFLKVRIPVNRSQYLFERNREKLKKYVSY